MTADYPEFADGGGTATVVVLSDIHYACSAEQARQGHELRATPHRWLRIATGAYRRYFWLRDPFAHNHLLDRFLAAAGEADLVVANGDYSCDTAFVGVSDTAARESARICLGTLRERYGSRFVAAFGDHELGKTSLVGGQGGLRLASWRRALEDLRLEPFWIRRTGGYVLVGVVSSLLALPVFAPETLPEELPEWGRLRADHVKQIEAALGDLDPRDKVILFCHDPTAVPFLARLRAVQVRLPQIEHTIIGHLHTRVIYGLSRILAGMPTIRRCGNSIRRMSSALHEARCWKAFNVRLCPSLAGCQLLKDGGFLRLRLDPDGREPSQVEFHRLPW